MFREALTTLARDEIRKTLDGHRHREVGSKVNFAVRAKPDTVPNVSLTAEGSYPQWTMHSAHFSFLLVP